MMEGSKYKVHVVSIYTCMYALSSLWNIHNSLFKFDACLQLYHRLQSGEALTFNNRRMVHSRTRFKLNGGVRHLQVQNHTVYSLKLIGTYGHHGRIIRKFAMPSVYMSL